jgi:hypothetical protein
LRGSTSFFFTGVGVVHVAVVGLVCQNVPQSVPPRRVVGQPPVLLGDLGRGERSPVAVEVGVGRVDVLDDVGVGVHRRLLQVAHKPDSTTTKQHQQQQPDEKKTW